MQFKPELCQCEKCETLLQSKFPGQFVVCECGESFVDQTKYYSRYGGYVKSIDYLLLQDFTTIFNIGYSKSDILIELAELVADDILTHYMVKRSELGGSSFEDLVNAGRGHKVIELLDAIKAGY
jgi:hypothetical protein